MNSKNKIKSFPDYIRVATFGCLFITCLMMIHNYLPKYLMENPPVCVEQGVVKEIISLSGKYATIKLEDGSIIKQSIKNYDSEQQVFKNKIEINQSVCVQYENVIIYELYKTLLYPRYR